MKMIEELAVNTKFCLKFQVKAHVDPSLAATRIRPEKRRSRQLRATSDKPTNEDQSVSMSEPGMMQSMKGSDMAFALFGSQCPHRIQARSIPSRDKTGHNSHEQKQSSYHAKYHRIERLCFVEHAADEANYARARRQAQQ